jgi:hypothetical protein
VPRALHIYTHIYAFGESVNWSHSNWSHSNRANCYQKPGELNIVSSTEGDQDNAYNGVAVATAGDVNGDFDDVIVGAGMYDNGEYNEGAAFLYHGSSTGPSSTANWTAEGNKDAAYCGHSVDSAGDVNNDGFDDVIVGAYSYCNGESKEGLAFLYLRFTTNSPVGVFSK